MADLDPMVPTDDLERLLMELVDGEPTPAQRLRLAALLRDDPDSRRRYTSCICSSSRSWPGSCPRRPRKAASPPGSMLARLRLRRCGATAGLRREGEEGRPRVAAAREAAPASGRAGRGRKRQLQPRWSRSRRRAAVAAAVVLAGLATLPRPPRRVAEAGAAAGGGRGRSTRGGGRRGGNGTGIDAARPGPKPADPRAVAVLTRAVNPVVGADRAADRAGLRRLPAGRLRLASGLVQLEFYGGVIVVLEGPADFDLIAADRAYSPPRPDAGPGPTWKSSKFSVGTPKTDVVDLGTEFGVVVDAVGGSEVQVFEGSVELRRRPSPRRRRPAADDGGEGLRIDAAGASRQAEAEPNAFVGPREMQQRALDRKPAGGIGRRLEFSQEAAG